MFKGCWNEMRMNILFPWFQHDLHIKQTPQHLQQTSSERWIQEWVPFHQQSSSLHQLDILWSALQLNWFAQSNVFFFRQIDFDSIWTYNGRVNFPPWLGGSVTRFYFTAGKTTVSWGLNARRTKSLLGSKAEGCVDTSLLNNWAPPHVMVFPIANKSNVLVLLSQLQC